MARGVNKVILIGNLGDEPLCRTTHSGCSVTNISMVTNEVRRNIDTGETTEYAEWHRVVMWGKLADIAKQYLHKGSQIYVEGKLRTRSFMDKQGQKRSVTEIVADEMQILGSRSQSSSLPQGNSYRNPRFNQGNSVYGQPNQNVYGNASQPIMTQPQTGYAQTPMQSPYGQSQANAYDSMDNGMSSMPDDDMDSGMKYNNMRDDDNVQPSQRNVAGEPPLNNDFGNNDDIPF